MLVTNNIVNNIYIAQTPDFETGLKSTKKKKVVKKRRLD